MWLEIAEKRWDLTVWSHDGMWYITAVQDEYEDEFVVHSPPCHELNHLTYMILALVAGIQNNALDS